MCRKRWMVQLGTEQYSKIFRRNCKSKGTIENGNSVKKEYRQVKDHNGETERGRKSCKFFKELDSILGHRPASVSAALLDTGISSSTVEETEETQIIGKKSTIIIQYLTFTAKDGDDVHAESPIDSAQVPESEAGPSKK